MYPCAGNAATVPIAAFCAMIALWRMFHMFPTSNKRQSSIIIRPSCGEQCSSPSFNARLLMNLSADHLHKHLSVLCLLLIWILKRSLCLCMQLRPSPYLHPLQLRSALPWRRDHKVCKYPAVTLPLCQRAAAECFSAEGLFIQTGLKCRVCPTSLVQTCRNKTCELWPFACVNQTAKWAT